MTDDFDKDIMSDSSVDDIDDDVELDSVNDSQNSTLDNDSDVSDDSPTPPRKHPRKFPPSATSSASFRGSQDPFISDPAPAVQVLSTCAPATWCSLVPLLLHQVTHLPVQDVIYL